MIHREDPEQHVFIPHLSLASEHSAPFSDLRATPDLREMRIWLDGEPADHEWSALDIARGGLSIVRKFEAVEHNNTRQNVNLIRQMSRSAFTLYQADKMVDQDGNLIAIALPRNAALQLGRVPKGPFDALRGSGIASNHLGLYVDDNDLLAVEAHDLDNMPQVEVLTAEDNTAVQIGLTHRNYVFPRDISAEGVELRSHPLPIGPLVSAIRTIPPQKLSGDRSSLDAIPDTPAQLFS